MITLTIFNFVSNNSFRYLDMDDENEKDLNITCSETTCPPGKGLCNINNQCVCKSGYITVDDPKDPRFCNYTQRKLIYALLLESFGFIGFGHLYVGRTMVGLIKLFSFYIIICYGTQFVISFMKQDTDTETAYYIKVIISLTCLLVPVIWHLVDLYNFANNKYLDGNNHQMKDW